MTDLAALWRRQADLCRGSSPLYERIALGLSEDPDVAALLLEAPPQQRIGVLMLAAVHHLLLGGAQHPLTAYYPSLGGTAEGDPYPAFRDFCLSHEDEVRKIVSTRNTQTNEVARAAAVLPALGLASASTGRALALVEVGASAGLNLLLDRYFYDYGPAGAVGDPASPVRLAPDVRGLAPPVPRAMPAIGSRAGIDVHPIDVGDDDAVRWLRACIWPEHRARAERFAAAVEIARADPPELVQGDAVAALGPACAHAPAGETLCVFHTAAILYLPPGGQEAFADVLRELSRARELFWIGEEGSARMSALLGIEDPRFADSYALTFARVRDGRIDGRFLARAAFHGEWLEWIA